MLNYDNKPTLKMQVKKKVYFKFTTLIKIKRLKRHKEPAPSHTAGRCEIF